MKTWVAVILTLLVSVGAMLGIFLPQRAEEKAQCAQLETELAVLEELTDLLENEKLGYANESFRAHRSAMVLQAGGESAELKLTANWEGGGNVFVDCSSDAAELSFTEESWDRYTVMQVKPVHPGVTVARFTSDATNQSFAVWILVEE